jgi:hypothetical protein
LTRTNQVPKDKLKIVR